MIEWVVNALRMPHCAAGYDGVLLTKAVDVADRMLPSFQTNSGLPWSTVRLRDPNSSNLFSAQSTCTACAGTFIMEMGLLSHLTGECIATYSYPSNATLCMCFGR